MRQVAKPLHKHNDSRDGERAREREGVNKGGGIRARNAGSERKETAKEKLTSVISRTYPRCLFFSSHPFSFPSSKQTLISGFLSQLHKRSQRIMGFFFLPLMHTQNGNCQTAVQDTPCLYAVSQTLTFCAIRRGMVAQTRPPCPHHTCVTRVWLRGHAGSHHCWTEVHDL